MSFLNALQAHRGGLLRIKSQLYWYGGRGGWDGVPGRIGLLLDVATDNDLPADGLDARTDRVGYTGDSAVLLLVDGAPHWVWVVAEDVEMLT